MVSNANKKHQPHPSLSNTMNIAASAKKAKGTIFSQILFIYYLYDVFKI